MLFQTRLFFWAATHLSAPIRFQRSLTASKPSALPQLISSELYEGVHPSAAPNTNPWVVKLRCGQALLTSDLSDSVSTRVSVHVNSLLQFRQGTSQVKRTVEQKRSPGEMVPGSERNHSDSPCPPSFRLRFSRDNVQLSSTFQRLILSRGRHVYLVRSVKRSPSPTQSFNTILLPFYAPSFTIQTRRMTWFSILSRTFFGTLTIHFRLPSRCYTRR